MAQALYKDDLNHVILLLQTGALRLSGVSRQVSIVENKSSRVPVQSLVDAPYCLPAGRTNHMEKCLMLITSSACLHDDEILEEPESLKP